MKKGYSLTLLEKFDKQPKWKGWTREHGLYEIEFSLYEVKNYSFRNTEYTIYDQRDNNPIELNRNVLDWMKATDLGNIVLKNGRVTMIGHFSKSGSQVFFNPKVE